MKSPKNYICMMISLKMFFVLFSLPRPKPRSGVSRCTVCLFVFDSYFQVVINMRRGPGAQCQESSLEFSIYFPNNSKSVQCLFMKQYVLTYFFGPKQLLKPQQFLRRAKFRFCPFHSAMALVRGQADAYLIFQDL